jgi:hypothetical protein
MIAHAKTLRLCICALAIVLASCGESADSRYDYGYDDGYATGYNTTCEIRATLIEGDWGDEHYSEGYRDGYAAGALECKRVRELD